MSRQQWRYSSSKLDMIMAILAEGVYRPWFWANYKSEDKQRELKAAWSGVASRFERWQIRQGLADWATRFGPEQPPSPDEFAEFIRPQDSETRRVEFGKIRQALS